MSIAPSGDDDTLWYIMTHMEEFSQVGAAIRAVRCAKGWSQRHLGEQAGVPQSHVAKLEGGKDVRVSTLLRILVALGYELALEPQQNSIERPRVHSALAHAQRYGVDLASLYRSARMSPADRLQVAVESANNLARLLPR
jgi:transcriptional regulator with XRE-family HTH domain